jgi:hypothetical protein
MTEFIPVVETLVQGEGSFDWAVAVEPSLRWSWITLGAETSDPDIARVVAKLAAANKIAMTGSLDSVVSALSAEHDLSLRGGLLVRDEHLAIEPGELSLLNEWREWHEVKPGARSPWLGDHPRQWVECGDEFAEIGFDGVSGSIRMTYAQVELALEKTAADLCAFHIRLEDWLCRQPRFTNDMARRFAHHFAVALEISA